MRRRKCVSVVLQAYGLVSLLTAAESVEVDLDLAAEAISSG